LERDLKGLRECSGLEDQPKQGKVLHGEQY
jgi:hypothetical protein